MIQNNQLKWAAEIKHRSPWIHWNNDRCRGYIVLYSYICNLTVHRAFCAVFL